MPLDQRQVGGDERHGCGVGRQRLLETQVPGRFPEIAFLEQPETVVETVVIVGAGGEAGDRVDDQINAQVWREPVGQMRSVNRVSGGVNDGAEILPRDRFSGEAPRGTPGTDAIAQRLRGARGQVQVTVEAAVGPGTQRPETFSGAVEFFPVAAAAFIAGFVPGRYVLSGAEPGSQVNFPRQRIFQSPRREFVAVLGQHSRYVPRTGVQHAVRLADSCQQGRRFFNPVNPDEPGERAVHESKFQANRGIGSVSGRREIGGNGAQIPVAIAVAPLPVFPGAPPEHGGEHQGRRVGGMVLGGRGDPPAQVAVAQARQGEVQRVEVVHPGPQAVQVSADYVDLGWIQRAGGRRGAIVHLAVPQRSATDHGGGVVEQLGQRLQRRRAFCVRGLAGSANRAQGGHFQAGRRGHVGQGYCTQTGIDFVQRRLVAQVDVLELGRVVERGCHAGAVGCLVGNHVLLSC